MFTGNGGLNLLLLSSKNEEDDSGLDQSCARFDDDISINGVIKPTPTGLCFLDAGVEWNGVRLNGEFLQGLALAGVQSSCLTLRFHLFPKVNDRSGG